MATTPPPARPEAVTRAPSAMVTAPEALTVICPPRAPSALPRADSSPVTMTEPPVPAMSIRPACGPALLALIRPPASTRFWTMPSAAAAVSCTVPPFAAMTPVLVTSAVTGLPSAPSGACTTWRVTSMDSSPSP